MDPLRAAFVGDPSDPSLRSTGAQARRYGKSRPTREFNIMNGFRLPV